MTIKISTKFWLTPEQIQILRPFVKHIRKAYPESEARLTKTGLWFVDLYRDHIANELRTWPDGHKALRNHLADWMESPTQI